MSAWLFLALLGAAATSGAVDCDAARGAVPAPEAVRAAIRDAGDHGYLWRIRKDGRTSYLYGTIHVGQLAWMFPGPRTRHALEESGTLALELDPTDPQIQRRLAAGAAAMPHAALPAALQERLQREAAALCVPYESLAPFAPEFQIVTLSVAAGRPEHLDANFGIDIGLATSARRAGQQIVSLETPEGQLRALQMRDAGETIAFVEDGLNELEPGRSAQLLRRLAQAWLRGDRDELAHYADWCQCLDTPIERTLMHRLLDERNPALADAVDRLHMGGQSVFAAVGSLHLFGPQGLPALLEQRGYRVERIDLVER